MTLDEELAVAIARNNMQDFLLRNAERWATAQPIAETGQFIVLTPTMEPCAVFFVDQQGNHIHIASLVPGHAYRVVVQALETVGEDDVNAGGKET